MRRAAQALPFRKEDIVLAGEPKAVGDNLISVEFAVVIRSNESAQPVSFPKEKLADVIKDATPRLARKLGHEVKGVYAGRQTAPTQGKPTSSNKGLVAGIVVAVLFIVLIVGVAVWYFRYVQRLRMPGTAEIQAVCFRSVTSNLSQRIYYTQ